MQMIDFGADFTFQIFDKNEQGNNSKEAECLLFLNLCAMLSVLQCYPTESEFLTSSSKMILIKKLGEIKTCVTSNVWSKRFRATQLGIAFALICALRAPVVNITSSQFVIFGFFENFS